MARETWVQSQVESYQRLKKWYLMPPCLTLSIIRYGSRVKWSNSGKGVAPSPTPWCSSYRKGSLRVTLDYCRQFYLLISISIRNEVLSQILKNISLLSQRKTFSCKLRIFSFVKKDNIGTLYFFLFSFVWFLFLMSIHC